MMKEIKSILSWNMLKMVILPQKNTENKKHLKESTSLYPHLNYENTSVISF